ncbi:PMT-domain-containing protein [Meredithblackwellia eburnea MCA 4105]
MAAAGVMVAFHSCSQRFDGWMGRFTAQITREWALLAALSLVAASLRIYRLGSPSAVSFDEVHFGVFTSYYMRREYFFDVHPPLAKLLLALAGWVLGYKGEFEFENIGESYEGTPVPYVGLRALPALFGTFVPAVLYATMREGGASVSASLLSAFLVLLDNAHVVQTKLILLDGPMIFFITTSIFTYFKFLNLRHREFSPSWWTWLFLTGASLSASIGCKMVGLFTILTVGSHVVIDLISISGFNFPKSYDLLSCFQIHLLRHFGARAFALILFPFALYLSFFWIHLAVLNHSGTGDEFMEDNFQRTLIEIRYFDTITIRHRYTRSFIHVSEKDLESSATPLVSAVLNRSLENDWIVEPTMEIPATGRGRIVRHDDVVTFRHALTNRSLSSSPNSSPYAPRFTTLADAEVRDNSTHFVLVIDEAHPGQQWLSKVGPFSLVHKNHNSAMVTRRVQSMVQPVATLSGTRHFADEAALWLVEDLKRSPDPSGQNRPRRIEKAPVPMSFWRRFYDLQYLMLDYNADITDSHPYTSHPITWPLMKKGIGYWTGPMRDRSQLYMIGNPVSWVICLAGLAVYPLIAAAFAIGRRRGLLGSTSDAPSTIAASGIFFYIGWAFHYFPFFTMERQLFLHHYLPAHIFSALVTGSAFDYITRRTRLSQRVKMAFVFFVIAVEVAGFIFISPLTYGTPLPSGAAVNRRRVYSSWTLQHIHTI